MIAALSAFLHAAHAVKEQDSFSFGDDNVPYDEINRLMAARAAT